MQHASVGHLPAFFLSGSNRFLSEHGRRRVSEPGVRTAPRDRRVCLLPQEKRVSHAVGERGTRPPPCLCTEDSEAWIDFS